MSEFLQLRRKLIHNLRGKEMRTLLIVFSLFIVFSITGCSQGPEYVKLNRENIEKLDLSKVTEVDLVSTPAEDKPELWRSVYTNIFPITDPEKMQKILHYIKTGEPIEYAAPFKSLLFKTKKRIYFLGIRWDTKACYGDFWESPELLRKLESWGLEHPKGESNLPKGQIFDGAPYDPNLINLDPNYIPFH